MLSYRITVSLLTKGYLKKVAASEIEYSLVGTTFE